MHFHSFHPFNPSLYAGRQEPYESVRARYWYQSIGEYQAQQVGLVGFACDQGVLRNQGRIGAKHAPNMIKATLAKLPISRDLQALHSELDIGLDSLVGDVGTIACEDNDQIQVGALEAAQQAYADQISQLIAADKLAVGIGGGHEIAFGSFLGLWQALQAKTPNAMPAIGVINFDAHLDLRQDQYATSGTPFRQIAEWVNANHSSFHYLCIGVSEFANTAALFDRAEELGVRVISDDECYRLGWPTIESKLRAFLDSVDVVYLTVDMDCLSASVMPAVSAVAAKGLSLDFVERCANHIIASGKVSLMDMAEVNPTYDIDGRGLKVSARLLAAMIGQWLLTKNRPIAAN